MALFDASTGGEKVNLTSGSPEYQSAIMEQTQRSLKPAYQAALKQTRQNFSNRGLMDSGIGLEGELGLQQDYLGKLASASTQAATRGADVGEENRRRLEQRSWAVEDRDKQLAMLKDQADRAEAQAGADRWAGLIGGAAGAAGTMIGGPLGGMVAGGLTSQLLKPKGEATPSASSGGLGVDTSMSMDPALAAYL